MDNKILTVSIPTYNRPEQLKRTLELLLPQLTEQCFLRIIDNHSAIPVKEYTESMIGHFPNVKYEIVRNKINVGADNNIMRCFEYCDTDWLWALGDDDILVKDAIKIILDDIKEFKDAVNINYYTQSPGHPQRLNNILSNGKYEHLINMDSFGNLIFISTNIYNCKHIKKKNDLAKGFHYTYSCAPHWFVSFNSIEKYNLTILSKKTICSNGVDSTIAFRSHTISNISFAFGFATFVDLLTSKEMKILLIKKLGDFTEWVTIDWIIRSLVVEYKKDPCLDIAFCLKQLYARFYKYFGLKITLKFWFTYFIFLISPNISYKLIRIMYLKKRNIDLNVFIS